MKRICFLLIISLQVLVLTKNGYSDSASGSVSLVPGKSIQLLPGTKISSGTVIAGKSIQLLPGTRITALGFVYATTVSTEKAGKNYKKVTRLVTVEENEKVLEQTALAIAASLISPFVPETKGNIQSGESSDGALNPSTPNDAAFFQENTNKLSAIVYSRSKAFIRPLDYTFYTDFRYKKIRLECRYVLRL